MVARAASSHNHYMDAKTRYTDANTPDAPKARRKQKGERVGELSSEIDERDEAIRLLNEALSRALDELTSEDRAAA